MGIHILCVTGMPEGVLVWVDRQETQTLVYVDQSLVRQGRLTKQGRARVAAALAATRS